MNVRRFSAILLSFAVFFTLLGRTEAASPKTKIQGEAILDHPCGKVALKYMRLVHAGRANEAFKLYTKKRRAQQKKMPVQFRRLRTEVLKDLSPDEFVAEIKSSGLLNIKGKHATLTLNQVIQSRRNGTYSETLTQRYALEGANCSIESDLAALN